MAKKALPEGTLLGVFQNATGSYTAGDHRFAPGAATAVPGADAEQFDTEAPVKFFTDAEQADKEIERLRKQFESQAKAAAGRS